MKIAFITTQSPQGSTVIGRVFPIAEHLATQQQVYILGHQGETMVHPRGVKWVTIGQDPFQRTEHGKQRASGIRLIARMKINALKSLLALIKIKPDIAIIVKPLPQNVLAAWLYRAFNRKTKFILDVDDFELTANHLTSITQRAAIHWSERLAAKLAQKIITATPFLQDHFTQLTAGNKPIEIIPTGIHSLPSLRVPPAGGTKQSPARSLRRFTPRDDVLLYIGSVSISSGHRVDLLPEILQQVKANHPNTKLIIAGSGDDIDGLKQNFTEKDLTDSAEWLGRFTQEDIPAILARTSIILDPIDGGISNRAKSSFRTALAAAAGIPIVTSNIGIRPAFIPITLHPKFFAQPNSPEDYAAKISSLISRPISPEETACMQSHAVQYTWEKLASKYEDVILRRLV